jgi:hypothetical protein
MRREKISDPVPNSSAPTQLSKACAERRKWAGVAFNMLKFKINIFFNARVFSQRRVHFDRFVTFMRNYKKRLGVMRGLFVENVKSYENESGYGS